MNVISFKSKSGLKHKTLILGAFETIHNGHLSLIEKAKELGDPISITMFTSVSDIPTKLNKTRYISDAQRLEQFYRLGVDEVIKIDFNNIKNMTSDEFLKILISNHHIKNIITGANFKFGHLQKGNVEQLKKEFENVHILELKKQDTKKISTSLLKEMVALGEFDLINTFTPFSWCTKGTIKKNDVTIDTTIKIHPGVYSVIVEANFYKYWGYLRITKTDMNIFIPQLDNFENEYNGVIHFIHTIRKITNIKNKPITTADIESAKNSFKDYKFKISKKKK